MAAGTSCNVSPCDHRERGERELFEHVGRPSARRRAPEREAAHDAARRADQHAVSDLLEREANPAATDRLLGGRERDEQREERD
jgi:hypothetical protein